ncbi:MAG TPA: retroviral-like aspartic protease family protein [Candidatus Dormibacteraeota bacterium]|nr:retroviral-like aspartic protease family protein [Candidatus Dormibacteraeota bacterium]
MKKPFLAILLLATLTPFPAQSQQNSGTLAGFLSKQGLAGAKLERRFGNHLLVPVSINNRRGTLMIDTGSPNTVIDANSVNTFGLTVEKTDSNVGGLFGQSWERFGTSKVKNIAMGNCIVTNVPVAIADFSNFNRARSGPATGSHIGDSRSLAHINGILGTNEMVKFGMIVDCARQMLYVNPIGRSPKVCQSLTGFLAARGFTRIPMRLNVNRHFDVEGGLNGHSTRFIVDTGSANTLIDKQAAVRSGTSVTALVGVGAGGAGGLAEGVDRTGVKELAIGNFKIANAEVVVAHVSGDILLSQSASESNSGVLGQEYLSSDFAVIDMGGMALYLRHPDSR